MVRYYVVGSICHANLGEPSLFGLIIGFCKLLQQNCPSVEVTVPQAQWRLLGGQENV